MTSDQPGTESPVLAPQTLIRALEQSHEVKEKVEVCAGELAPANDAVKVKIAHRAQPPCRHTSRWTTAGQSKFRCRSFRVTRRK
jgi:hypothetical protein